MCPFLGLYLVHVYLHSLLIAMWWNPNIIFRLRDNSMNVLVLYNGTRIESGSWKWRLRRYKRCYGFFSLLKFFCFTASLNYWPAQYFFFLIYFAGTTVNKRCCSRQWRASFCWALNSKHYEMYLHLRLLKKMSPNVKFCVLFQLISTLCVWYEGMWLVGFNLVPSTLILRGTQLLLSTVKFHLSDATWF